VEIGKPNGYSKEGSHPGDALYTKEIEFRELSQFVMVARQWDRHDEARVQ